MKDFNEKCAEYLGWNRITAPISLYKLCTIYWIDDNKKEHFQLKFDSDWNWIIILLEVILEECYEEGDLEPYYIVTDAIPVLEDTKQAIYNYITNNE